MSIFKRNKKRKMKLTQLSPKTQMRKIIYDSGCRNPDQVAVLLGIGSISDDVAEMEIRDSERRIGRIAPIMPIIEACALVAAQVSAMAFVQGELEDGEDAPSEEVVVALTHMFKLVSFSSAIACMSNVVDLGLLVEGYENGE